MDWSVVCDCGISLSYSLTFQLNTSIDLAKPDIILGDELTADIEKSEVFPDSFDTFGKYKA